MDGDEINSEPTTEEEPQESAGAQEENKDEAFSEGYDPFREVKELLESGDIDGAQLRLDEFEERGAEWHYMQSVIYRKRNWFSLSKSSLTRALGFDPENEEYKRALEELENMAESGKKSRKKKKRTRAMGGENSFCNACAEGGCECCAMVGCELCCQAACDGCSNC